MRCLQFGWRAFVFTQQEEESEKNRAIRANSKANRIEPATQIHILVADRTRLLGRAYSTSLAAYEPSWPVNSNWLHVEVNFYGSVKRHS